MRIPRWTALVCFVCASSLVFASEDDGRKLLDSIFDLLSESLKLGLRLQVENEALRKALGDEKADQAIGAEMAKPHYNVGDSVDIILDDGSKKEIKGKVASISNDNISIITSDGGSTLKMGDLRASDQWRFGYDPAQFAKKLKDEVDATYTGPSADPTTEPELTKPTATASGKPLEDKLNIISMDAKVVKTGIDYEYIGWKTVIYNNTSNVMNDVYVTFYFHDSDNFEVDHDSEKVFRIKAGESATVTGQLMMKPEDWKKVSSYSVKTE